MRKPLLIGSIALHAAAFGALAVIAFWRIEKVPVDYHPDVVASFALPKNPGGGGAPKSTPLVPKEQPKVVPTDHVQITHVTKEERPATGPTTGDVNATGTGPGTGPGPGGPGNGEGGCDPTICGETKSTVDVTPPIIKVEIPKTKVEREIVRESEVKRISGDGHIEAPNSVKLSMQRDDVKRVIGSVQLCADTDGVVTSAKLTKSTGYDAYDDKLVSEMRTWRYKPYTNANGDAAPFCTSIQLVYIMR